MPRIGLTTAANMALGALNGVGSGSDAYAPGGASRRKPAPAKADAKDRSSKLDGVRARMRDGYYRSAEVDEAISDKLSGAFDTLA